MSEHWLARRSSVRLLWRLFIVVLALTAAAQLLFPPTPHFAVERLFAFNALYGLLACAGMILFAKAIGVLLKRRDDYYEKRDFPD